MDTLTVDTLLNTTEGQVAIAVIVGTSLAYLLYKVFGATRNPVALTPEFAKYPLIEKEVLSHDTRRFTFALPSPNHILGLPIGQHMTLRFTDQADGKSHQRSYTPVTGNETLGKVSFVIKVYKAGVHPKFPNGGKLSQHLDSLSIGDTMDMKGPKGHLTWNHSGKFTLKLSPRKPLEYRSVQYLNMIAGGTGITPMLQILHAIFRNPNNNHIKMKMIYANQTEDDILVRGELEALANEYPERFTLHYTLDRPPTTGWTYSTGFITKEMMEKHLFDNNQNQVQTFMCGPPPMIKFACIPNLQAIGFNESQWFVF